MSCDEGHKPGPATPVPSGNSTFINELLRASEALQLAARLARRPARITIAKTLDLYTSRMQNGITVEV
jgi:hypothetical protein